MGRFTYSRRIGGRRTGEYETTAEEILPQIELDVEHLDVTQRRISMLVGVPEIR